jgi:aconitate hydratase
VRQAVEDIQPGAYETLPYTSKVLAEQLVRKADAENLTDYLKQLIERRQDMDFPWYFWNCIYFQQEFWCR